MINRKSYSHNKITAQFLQFSHTLFPWFYLDFDRLLGEPLPAMRADRQVNSPPSFCSWWICSWSRDDRQRQGFPPECCNGPQTQTHSHDTQSCSVQMVRQTAVSYAVEPSNNTLSQLSDTDRPNLLIWPSQVTLFMFLRKDSKERKTCQNVT